MALDVCRQHYVDSHSAEKDTSKHLKVKQILTLHTGIRCAPSQSDRALRRNLVNFSPDKRIDPIKIRVVRCMVAKFSADLTLEQLGNYKIDDSFGSLVQYTDFKSFSSPTSIFFSPSSSTGLSCLYHLFNDLPPSQFSA
jgi:hypothetical protein